MTKPRFGLATLLLVLTLLTIAEAPNAVSLPQASRYVQVQCVRSDEQMDHIFLQSGQTIVYNASSRTSDGLNFDSFSVQMNSTDLAFLQQLVTDLYIESYDYFGALGAWTSRQNFTITNPTAVTQELFLRIVRNYQQTTYAPDIIAGEEHTIGFSTSPEADRVFVRFGFFAALIQAQVNGSEVDFGNPTRSPDAIRVEYLPNYVSFQIPPNRIQNSNFIVKVEERDFSAPSSYCYISALIVQHRDISLAPKQKFLFDLPALKGWSYLAGAAYTNLTASAYPQPYPFQLINMSIWDPTQTPLLVTALDTTFGVLNISNQTWALSFDLLFYYWQNQTALAFTHRILSDTLQSIIHEVSVNVSDANVGSDLGLSGQYLRFQVPGATIGFEAPDPVGKYPQSYIPLRKGAYTLETSEPRISAEVTSQIDELQLTNTLHFNVTYGGDPYANAAITVTQRGTFTSRTYNIVTDQNGLATIALHSGEPEQVLLSVTVAKDQDNVSEKTISYFIGTAWIATVAVLVAVFLMLVWLVMRRHKGWRNPR